MRIHGTWLFCAAIVLAGGLAWVHAAVSPDQQKKVVAAAAALGKIENLIKAKKYDAAGKLLTDAQALILELAPSPDLTVQVGNLTKRLEPIRGKLASQGLTLPDFKLPDVQKPDPKATSGKNAGNKNTGNNAGGISFTRQIAPFLIARCGNCHVTGSRGGLNFASYELIEKGSQGKLLLVKGDSKNSEGIREIESGNMPRGGGKVAPEELAIFKKWIDDGAKFDGPDPKAQLTTLVPRSNVPPMPAMEAPKLEVASATGKETVSFSKDLAPILVATCFDCHGGGQNGNRGGLVMSDFAALLRGGDSGLPLTPGKPGESLLVKKLKGTAGDRMPKDKPPLADSQIKQFEQWIAEGARFDGGDAALNLGTLVDMLKAQAASHEQLSADRRKKAEANFRVAIPDEQAVIVEGKNTLVIGNVGKETLQQIADAADAQLISLASQFKVPADQPPVKGRITLFALKQRYDYAEWKMVEQREIPVGLRGHVRYNVIDAYGVMWVPANPTDFSLKLIVQEQANALFIANLGQGKLPQWFSSGAGKVLAAKGDARDPRIKFFDDSIAGQLRATENIGPLLANNLGGEANDVLAYGFVKSLMKKSSNFSDVVKAVRNGADFDSALAKQYGGNARQLLYSWSGKKAW